MTEEQTGGKVNDDLCADIIFEYTLEQALEDGVLVDANEGEMAEVTRQHAKFKVYMTRALFDLIERAVKNKRQCNDWKGVWHDILWMSQGARRAALQDGRPYLFKVIITGTGRKRLHTLRVELGFASPESKEPHWVYMMDDED
jgi:hypothetical protein